MAEVLIISGAYGVGKSEFATQLALSKTPCTIVDLDIINPYFRPREQALWLASQGVNVVGSLLKNHINQDFPAMSGELRNLVYTDQLVIVDLAGSENGLKPLASYTDILQSAQVWIVVNLNRPESQPEHIKTMIELFQSRSHLKVTGLVHNTHWLDETTTADIIYSQAICEQVAKDCQLPIRYTMIPNHLLAEVQAEINNPILTFKRLILRPDWMKGEFR